MTAAEKIRHRPLVEAVKLLAYRNAMQADPLLLLFLQNLTESFEQERVLRVSLQQDVESAWRAHGRLQARVNRLEGRHES